MTWLNRIFNTEGTVVERKGANLARIEHDAGEARPIDHLMRIHALREIDRERKEADLINPCDGIAPADRTR